MSFSFDQRGKLAILADDFTGACDAAAPFAAAGRCCRVALELPPHWPEGVDVLSVDLDLRAADSECARRAMCEAAASLRGETSLYVKVDSTLRGPVAALVLGALEGSGAEQAVVAPAFPEHGRVYRGGRLGGDGPRLHEVLGEVAVRCRIVDDPAQVTPGEGMLLVGSGGLARVLAGPRHVQLPRISGSVLVVAGSPAVETQRQLDRLPPAVEVLRTAPPTAARDAGEAAASLAELVRQRASPALHEERAVGTARPGLLVLTGGQTARLVCESLQVQALDLLGEVQPGIPVGRLHGGAWHNTLVVTKAGGFGGPEALLDVVRLLGPSCQHNP